MTVFLSKYITAYIIARKERRGDNIKTKEDNTLEENILDVT